MELRLFYIKPSICSEGCFRNVCDGYKPFRFIRELLRFQLCVKIISFNVWVRLCRISKSQFEIHNKISSPYIERCASFHGKHIRALISKSSEAFHSRTSIATRLTPLPLDKMDAISQTISSDAFSWIKSFVFWLKFHWSVYLSVQLTITKHWFRWWLGAE